MRVAFSSWQEGDEARPGGGAYARHGSWASILLSGSNAASSA
ncbi:MAG: hypothetical protein ACR2JF_01420 [Iamia sp.]